MKRFDPFNDRLARDIRNNLAKSVIRCLKEGSTVPAEKSAASFGRLELENVYADYIKNRLKSYRAVLGEIQRKRVSDSFLQALIFWNHGLFFEFHEVLESIWKPAKGQYRRALQGMIIAAGVYIHRQQGNEGAAVRMAEKAWKILSENRKIFKNFSSLDNLLEALKNNDPCPPLL